MLLAVAAIGWGAVALAHELVAQEPLDPDLLAQALVEPSLADDGVISAAERREILGIAERLMDAERVATLSQRLDALASQPVHARNATEHEPAVPLAADCNHDCCPESPWQNLSVFLGLDGSKQPQDLGVNAHMGGRFAINYGMPLWEEYNLGVQIGSAVSYTAHAVQVVEALDGTSERFQSFTTLALFQRTDAGWKWAIGYDYQAQNYYQNFDYGQWRGLLGYDCGPRNELGVWYALRDNGDTGSFMNTPVTLRPINQANFYWRHTWENFAETTCWAGVAEGHGTEVFVFPVSPALDTCFTYGARLQVPLGDRVALFGEANFITPADSGTVDAYLGFAFYPYGGAHGALQRRYSPLLPVASNPTMAIDLRR